MRRCRVGSILALSGVVCTFIGSMWGTSAQCSPHKTSTARSTAYTLSGPNKAKVPSKLHDVKIDWYMPPGMTASSTEQVPVVLIYHGSGGLGEERTESETRGFFAELAKALAVHRVCGVVHYMDSTGHKFASSKDMARYFGVWLGAVQSSVHAARQYPFVDSAKVTLMGHSLGAQLALEAAARDRQIRSVVDMAGCFVLPTGKIVAMPPVLVLHGKLDNVVPLAREKALIKVLDRVGSKHEEHIYPRGDHAFNGVAFEDIVQTTNKFLLKY